jgi:alanine racemase
MEYAISNKTWVTVDGVAMRHNILEIARYAPDVPFMVVVKSNAYGAGIVFSARIARDCDAAILAVDDILEAVLLRKSGDKGIILVLGATLPEYASLAQEHDITITVATHEQLQTALRHGLNFHLKVDTGLGRQGFLYNSIDEVINTHDIPVHQFAGIYSHLAAAEVLGESDFTRLQYERLEQVSRIVDARFGTHIPCHISATAANMMHDNNHLDYIRIGIGAYGYWPSDEVRMNSSCTLVPAIAWYARMSEVKSLPAGYTIGYDRTHTLERDSVVAVVPVGYWHGYPRGASNRGYVIVRGMRAPIIGRVSMDMFVVDVTDIPGVLEGDVATLCGKDIPAETLAQWGNTINYEIITTINPLVERRYL